MNNRGRDPMHSAHRFLCVLHSDDAANATHPLARLSQENPAFLPDLPAKMHARDSQPSHAIMPYKLAR